MFQIDLHKIFFSCLWFLWGKESWCGLIANKIVRRKKFLSGTKTNVYFLLWKNPLFWVKRERKEQLLNAVDSQYPFLNVWYTSEWIRNSGYCCLFGFSVCSYKYIFDIYTCICNIYPNFSTILAEKYMYESACHIWLLLTMMEGKMMISFTIDLSKIKPMYQWCIWGNVLYIEKIFEHLIYLFGNHF